MLSSARLRRFAGLTSMLFTGTLLGSALAFVSQMVLARSLSLPEFGRLSALLAVINLFTPIASASVNWLLLRVFGREGWDAVRWLHPAAWLVALATSLSCVGLAFYVDFSDVAPVQADFVFIASALTLLGQVAVELGSSSLQLEDRYTALTLWQMTTQAGRFLVVLAASAFGWTTEVGILAGYGVLGLVLTTIGAHSVWSLWRKAASRSGRGWAVSPRLWDTLSESGPCTLVTVFYLLYFQGPVLVIAWLAGPTVAAECNAAFLIFSAFALIPNVIYVKFLAAKLCRWAEKDRATFAAAFHIGVPAMAVLGGGLAVILFTTAHWLIPLLYGAKYANAATLVMIRALAIPIGFAQMTYSSLFISGTDMTRKVVYLGAAAAISLTLNVLLVPTVGIVGAAVASFVAEAALLLLHIQGAARHIPGIEISATLRPATIVGSLRHLLQPEQSESSRRAAV